MKKKLRTTSLKQNLLVLIKKECNSHCLIEKGNSTCAKIIFSDDFNETNLKAMKTSKNQKL